VDGQVVLTICDGLSSMLISMICYLEVLTALKFLAKINVCIHFHFFSIFHNSFHLIKIIEQKQIQRQNFHDTLTAHELTIESWKIGKKLMKL